MGSFSGIASLAGRIIRDLRQQATRQLSRTDAAVQRVKTEAVTRRAMMDAALRKKHARRDK